MLVSNNDQALVSISLIAFIEGQHGWHWWVWCGERRKRKTSGYVPRSQVTFACNVLLCNAMTWPELAIGDGLVWAYEKRFLLLLRVDVNRSRVVIGSKIWHWERRSKQCHVHISSNLQENDFVLVQTEQSMLKNRIQRKWELYYPLLPVCSSG